MKYKICVECKASLSIKNFYTIKRKTYSYCKSCTTKLTIKRQHANKVKAILYLGGKCLDCGISGPPVVFDFHHENVTKKDFTLSKRVGRAFENIKSELDKCILLCSNCHRQRHSDLETWTF